MNIEKINQISMDLIETINGHTEDNEEVFNILQHTWKFYTASYKNPPQNRRVKLLRRQSCVDFHNLHKGNKCP
jgi:hypothetical protein